MIHLLIAGGLVVSLSYYLLFGSREPLFIGGKARLRNVLNIVSMKTGVYSPTPWSSGGYLQTIFGTILRTRPKVTYRSEHLETPDGGVLKLDWNQNEDNKLAAEGRNIVLILPGLTGTSNEQYVQHFVQIAENQGFLAVVMNHRGLSPPPKTYRFCCASNSDDLEFVLEHINKSSPDSRICAVGVSLGGLVLTNHLVKMSTSDQDSFLHAAFVISMPWDSFAASRSLEQPLNWLLFNRHLTRRLQRIFDDNVAILKAQEIEVPTHVHIAAKNANTIREYDDAVTAPMFGYRDVNQYYSAVSISGKPFESLKTPLLCLNAADDPFSPYEQIPVERIRNCENVALILTHTGGHVGFLEGLLPNSNGYMNRVYQEYIKAVFEEL